MVVKAHNKISIRVRQRTAILFRIFAWEKNKKKKTRNREEMGRERGGG